jgi:WASH complex subunit 7, N-terminal
VQIPCVILLGSVVWYMNEFLAAKLPHMGVDKKSLAAVANARLAYLQQTVSALVR